MVAGWRAEQGELALMHQKQGDVRAVRRNSQDGHAIVPVSTIIEAMQNSR